MATKPGIPKGTRDFSPVEMAKRNYIFDTIREVFHLFPEAFTLCMVSSKSRRLPWRTFLR